MSLRQSYLRFLAGIVPAGAIGISLFLGSTALSVARIELSTSQELTNEVSVSERHYI